MPCPLQDCFQNFLFQAGLLKFPPTQMTSPFMSPSSQTTLNDARLLLKILFNTRSPSSILIVSALTLHICGGLGTQEREVPAGKFLKIE